MCFDSSLLIQDRLESEVKGQRRFAQQNSIVDCYRNLNKMGMFSVRARDGEFKGKVVAYAPTIVLANPQLVISPAGRARCEKSRIRNVHAYVRGVFTGAYSQPLPVCGEFHGRRITYSPFKHDQFFEVSRDASGRQIQSSFKPVTSITEQYAIISGADVWLVDAI